MSSKPTPARNPLHTISSQPTHDAAGNLLPAILCLHGGGSNITVFKIQTRRLVWNLNGRFRLVYAQGPIVGQPGTDMLPTFASCAPFYRWIHHQFRLGDGGHVVERTPAAEVRGIDETLRAVMRENGGEASFVGVVGFSQGARVVAGLLLRQAMRERAGYADELGFPRFRFGVMVGGPWPPIGVNDTDAEAARDPALEVHVEDYAVLKGVPSVHAWGTRDPGREWAARLYDEFRGDVAWQMDFEGGHHLPLTDGEAKHMCDLIVKAWEAGGGAADVSTSSMY